MSEYLYDIRSYAATTIDNRLLRLRCVLGLFLLSLALLPVYTHAAPIDIAVSTPSLPSNNAYLNSTPDFYWTGPSASTVSQLGSNSYYSLEVSLGDPYFAAENIVVRVSTPALVVNVSLATADGSYVSTSAFTTEGVYYWRIKTVNGIDQTSSPWSQISSFVIDFSSPEASGFQIESSTGGLLVENQIADLANGVTVQLKVQDGLSGLAAEYYSPANTIGHWRFNEGSGTTAMDVSGSGHNGSLNAGASWAAGRYSNAVSFNGSGMVTIGSLGAFPTRGTLAFYLNASEMANYRNPLATKYNGSNSGIRFEENIYGTFGIGVGNDAATVDYVAYINSGMQVNKWYHIAYVWDRTTNREKCYLDGKMTCDQAHTYWPTTIPDFRIGTGFSTESERQWKGLIDDVYLLSESATSESIRKMLNDSRYSIRYSTNAGQSWRTVTSTNTSDTPYLGFTGVDGSTDQQVLTAYRLSLAASTNTQTCNGSSPCGATNQVVFYMSDRSGNIKTAGPYSIIVNIVTPPIPAFPADGTYLNTATPVLTWTPLEDGVHHLQLALDEAFTQVLIDSATSNTYYVPTLTNEATYYWRVKTVNGLDQSFSRWSQARSFIIDFSSPEVSAFQIESSTGGWLTETQVIGLTNGVTVQLTVQDYLSGITSYNYSPANISGHWRFNESSGTVAQDLSRFGHNGVLNSGATWAAGKFSNSVSFNGTGMVTIGNLGAFPARGTLAFYLNASEMANYRNPLATKYNGGSAGIRFEENSSGVFSIGVGNDAGATDYAAFFGSGMQANKWYHIAYVWDRTTNREKCYVDGNTTCDNAHTYWPTTIPDFRIGTGFSTESERQWKGSVDDVYLLDEAASDESIMMMTTVYCLV